jgi:hypothetical protein
MEETLPEAVRVFRDMFSGSTPPDSYFGLSPKMEGGLIPKGEEEEPKKVRKIGFVGFFLLLHYYYSSAQL